jgi:hypothetical protein
MRIHSDKLREQDIYDALKSEKESGRIADSVHFRVMTVHGSKSHELGFEVQLESHGQIKGDGRRRGNSGQYGPMGYDDGYAATFDEYGFFLAALFRLDPEMVCGTVKHPIYDGVDDYNEKTAETYTLGALVEQLDRGYDPYPWAYKVRVGRYGAGRFDQNRYGVYTYKPRDAAWYRKFAHLAEVPA